MPTERMSHIPLSGYLTKVYDQIISKFCKHFSMCRRIRIQIHSIIQLKASQAAKALAKYDETLD